MRVKIKTNEQKLQTQIWESIMDVEAAGKAKLDEIRQVLPLLEKIKPLCSETDQAILTKYASIATEVLATVDKTPSGILGVLDMTRAIPLVQQLGMLQPEILRINASLQAGKS